MKTHSPCLVKWLTKDLCTSWGSTKPIIIYLLSLMLTYRAMLILTLTFMRRAGTHKNNKINMSKTVLIATLAKNPDTSFLIWACCSCFCRNKVKLKVFSHSIQSCELFCAKPEEFASHKLVMGLPIMFGWDQWYSKKSLCAWQHVDGWTFKNHTHTWMLVGAAELEPNFL